MLSMTTRGKHATLLCIGLFANCASVFAATPSYISSLAAYEVRRLDGNFLPTASGPGMHSVTPAEWLNGGSGINVNIINPWSGGGKAISGTKMFVHGGGHSDSANNGLYVYDFAGDARPTGWSLMQISAVSSVRGDTGVYADGLPAAHHTYNGNVYAHHNNRFYRF